MTIKTFLKNILPPSVFNIYYHLLALCAACIYRFPAYKLTVIGVTGTNGKSTCVYMIDEIFKEAGRATCSASSIDFTIKDRRFPNMLKMTMAGPFILQRFLRKAVDSGCAFAILEITSEGIMQNRHCFIPFHTAVFTNMSPEHIERHGSFESYRREKAKLFHGAQCVVVNCDDEQAEYFLQISTKESYGYTLRHENAHEKLPIKKLFVIRDVIQRDGGVQFTFENTIVHLSLPGEFNVRNAAEALMVATIHGIAVTEARHALEGIRGIPGRMETVIEKPVKVVVDYAHTPVALENVYKTLHDDNPSTNFICVLGATGGGRDKWKRPEFGKLAATYCSHIILTDEDPYNEDPRQIISEVKRGIPQSFSGKCEEILNRRKAIARALEVAKYNDVVVITGKGCEPYMVTSKGKISWDDRAIVREEMEKRKMYGKGVTPHTPLKMA